MKLIISNILLLVMLYITDTVLLNCGMHNSQLLPQLYELFMFTLILQIGYIFARSR